jgi:pimeloyl-ACP methyl ester carboxylesterase
MNNKYIVVGIDGTGSREWMSKDGSNSSTYKFIRDVHYGAMDIDRRWYHGPSNVVTGSDTEPILQEALDFIYQRIGSLFPDIRSQAIKPLEMFDVNSCMQNQERTTQNYMASRGYSVSYRKPIAVTQDMLAHQPLTIDDVRVVLIGHSRGGLATTALARMLSPLVRVYFMGLYDSVDREGCLDGMNVENVKFVAHARRHPEVKSRTYFSNTSLKYIGVDHAEERFFYTSHGGMGGSFVTRTNEVSAFGDSSCLPTIDVQTEEGPIQLINNPALVKQFGKKMDQICADGSSEADQFIRTQAKKYGIPVS